MLHLSVKAAFGGLPHAPALADLTEALIKWSGDKSESDVLSLVNIVDRTEVKTLAA